MSEKIELENYEEFKLYLMNHTRKETANQFNITLSKVDALRVELNIPRKTFRYRELPSQLTPRQLDVVIGSLLGDGSLDLVGRHGKRNSKFTEVHSAKQLQWLEWKMKELEPFSCNLSIREVDGRKNLNNKIVSDPTKKLTSCRLETVVHPIFTELEKEWYLRDADNNYILHNDRRIKKLPNDLILTPEIIFVWFIDDGSNNPKKRQAAFNSQSFTRDECEILVEKLKVFGLNCHVCKNRDRFIIQTAASSYLDLVALVKERTSCECMFYKTDMSEYKNPDYSTRFASQGKTQRQNIEIINSI